MRYLTLFLLALIRCYKLLISPLLPPSCRYLPTCSSYCAEAIITHGPIKGIIMGFKRIIRCHPFSNSGYDPVSQPLRRKK